MSADPCALCRLHDLGPSTAVLAELFGSGAVGRRLDRAAGLVHRRHRREGNSIHQLAAAAVELLTAEAAA